jgi:hypothetical protein
MIEKIKGVSNFEYSKDKEEYISFYKQIYETHYNEMIEVCEN